MIPNFSKIILGTAQLGMPYGLGAWKNELMPEAEAFSILDAAWDLGVTALDTSPNYGVAEKRISKFLRLNPSKNFDIISKVKSSNKRAQQSSSAIEDWLNKSPLFDVGTPCTVSVLLHNEQDIRCKAVLDTIQKFQTQGYFSCWGVSVYSTEAALQSINIDHCQMIQLPFGVLNQSFHSEGTFKVLSSHNKIIHARSIFTQGLLYGHKLDALSVSDEIPQIIGFISDLADRQGLTLMQYAISFAMSFDAVNSIVLGVDTVKQLNEAMKCLNSPLSRDELDALFENVRRLTPEQVRPERWN
jgi:aryl-alcohol dehydrogenase-like predicted oxidoreductase